MPKTESARLSIQALNPDVEVVEHRTRLDADNILEIIDGYDILVDGADNFPTRYLLNDAAVRLRKPVVSASILAFDGQISTFVPYEGPCYRCLYPVPPPPEMAPSCGAAGVLGVMAGVMGLLQANEVIKLAAGIGEPLIGRLLLYDSLGTRFTELKVKRDPDCPICGDGAPEIPESEMGKFPDYEAFCAGSDLAAASSSANLSAASSQEPQATGDPSLLLGSLRERRVRARYGAAGRTRPSRDSVASANDWQRLGSEPMPTVKIPPVLRPETGGDPEVSADGSTVGGVLRAVAESHPGTRAQLFADDGELNRYVNVYLNDEDVRVLSGLETPVSDSDTVVILPAMAGGSRSLASLSGLRCRREWLLWRFARTILNRFRFVVTLPARSVALTLRTCGPMASFGVR